MAEKLQPQTGAGEPRRAWIGPVVTIVLAAATFAVGLLAASIMERRWEAQRPVIALKPIAEWEPRNEVWGDDYPREYESFEKTQITGTRTLYGGSWQRDYLQEDPRQVILFAGYAFSREYKQARGHYWSRNDVWETGRVRNPVTNQPLESTAGTCWTCKSTDVPRLMHERGVAEFYASRFVDLADEVRNSIGCQDCHDPKTLNLRITRPALREAFEKMGRNVDEAPFQEMRSLVCAQCHVEYYFQGPGKYLTFPWTNGLDFESIERYYDEHPEFRDYVHAVSGTPIVKMQHPDYEIYTTGIHAYRGVSCADCHMPYRTEGGVKFTDHHVQSPLLNIAASCAVCHRWTEEEIRARVEGSQKKVEAVMLEAEDALVRAHFDVAAAVQAGATDDELAPLRGTLRRAQMRWDFVSASNGMGFHSPQECTRILAQAVGLAQQVRVDAARVLASHGITAAPLYPDVSTRERAAEVVRAFAEGPPPRLVPAKATAE